MRKIRLLCVLIFQAISVGLKKKWNDAVFLLEILNFVLEINNKKMKQKGRGIQKLVASGLLIGLAGLWFFLSKTPFNPWAYLLLGLLVVFGAYALYQGITALRNEGTGLSAIDEFSLRIKEKAAARTITFSIFLWLFIILFGIDWLAIQGAREMKITIFFGMAATMLFFLLAQLYFSKTGFLDEN